MGIVKKVQRQDLSYWAPEGEPTPDGQRQWALPVAMRCRWDDKVTEVHAPNGDNVLANHELIVSGPLVPGGMVALGKPESFATPTDPVACGALLVIATATTPSIRQQPSKTLYEAWC